MALSPAERVMTPLRRAAEAAEEASAPRVETIRGALVATPPPRGKHAGIINAVAKQLLGSLPAHLDAFQVASVSLPDDADDYATPDLMVCDAAFGESDDWLADPADVELVVEAVSKGNSTKDTRDMVTWYADAGIPAYLLIDPRDGTWALRTAPRDGEFPGSLRGRFGEGVELAALGLKIANDGFVRYA
ncbi:Uma2 family endonuclease [Streptomyces buecherae]|uniref:Uma2 family endonuclease n=1 Tax=Streptomyces buecherae TaxID=2763006 RepID=A0A7H8NAU3_9ACTN|nr:Uma2 family endonuclease [Streptomyces buecherae]QKW51597.1 Uma2 family endonuclease [Streptomyces buecherae]